MSLQTQSASLLQCGAFEIDLRAGELRKQGVRIKLQEQPFLVLKILVARPGEIVSREELRSQIWSADTFVDFDNSLNTAINKLREALGDSAENPRFIETVPRRGYRFVAPVSVEGVSAVRAPTLGTATWKIVVPAAALVLGLAGAGFYWRSRQSHRLTEKDKIVLADFVNSTGDTVFDGTLREGLSVDLEQSPFISLLSAEEIHQTLRRMGRKSDARLTPEIAFEVCQRTSSSAALSGSIALFGTRYRVILEAVDCTNGNSLASAEAQAKDKSHILDALGTAASDMRRKLGESLNSLQTYNTPLAQATTPSLEALQAFSLGYDAEGRGDFAAALPFFEKATQLDPSFAAAYDEMANSYAGLGETGLSEKNMDKAFALRSGVSEHERLGTEADYYSLKTGDLIKARRIGVLAVQIYPRDQAFYNQLGTISNSLGQYEQGLKENLEALRLGAYPILYRSVLINYLCLARIDEARALAEQARAKGLDSHAQGVLYSMAFYRDEPSAMAQEVADASGVPGEEDLLLAMEADTAAYFGRLEKARELSRRAVGSAKLSTRNETAATYLAVEGLREALFGNPEKAHQQATLALKLSSGRDLNYGIGLALAYAGNNSQAKALADNLAKRFPEDTIAQFNYLPALRAKLVLCDSKPELAPNILDAAIPFELGLPSGSRYNWPNLYPVYVRGEAYLALHRGREAAAEFQKILDHRGIVLNEPIGALAHLQLGRAYTMSRDTAKARAAYQDFLALWKDADPDLTILKQAKAEYAKLQ